MLQTIQYPCKVVQNTYGKCVIATQDIAVGTIVQKFDGPIVKYEDVPIEERCYVGCQADGLCTIPLTCARYINHSCDPNCLISPHGDVLAVRLIKEGEEITFDYVTISRKEFEQNPQAFFWDPVWSFDCQCHAPNCHKRIDRYIIKD